MLVTRILVEQIDWDGKSKSIAFDSREEQPMWIAFPDDYDEPRIGPFHFKDRSYQAEFTNRFDTSDERKIGQNKFTKVDGMFSYQTQWHSVPDDNTYYALYLPEFAILKSVEIKNNKSGEDIYRKVWKEIDDNRYVIYILGDEAEESFSFNLNCTFYKDIEGFHHSQYNDSFQADFYGKPYSEKKVVGRPQANNQNYFANQIIVNNTHEAMANKNNPWGSGSFYFVVVIIFLVIIAVIANYLPLYILPVIIIGSALLVGLVGALQLRNDDRLSEANFGKLMIETYKRLPLLRKK